MRTLIKLLPLAAIAFVILVNVTAVRNSSLLDISDHLKVSMTTGIEMHSVAEAVALEFSASGQLPLDDFSRFLSSNMMEKNAGQSRDTWRDLWGTPYRLSLGQKEGGIYIWSAGKDKIWNNEDDLKHYRTLFGLGRDQSVFTPAHLLQWRKLAASYRSTDEPNVQDEARVSPLPEPSSQALEKKPVNEADRRLFEFQKLRASRGSATAKLALAERYIAGDDFVDADLGRAKILLEEAVEQLDSETYRTKARMLLDQVLSKMK